MTSEENASPGMPGFDQAKHSDLVFMGTFLVPLALRPCGIDCYDYPGDDAGGWEPFRDKSVVLLFDNIPAMRGFELREPPADLNVQVFPLLLPALYYGTLVKDWLRYNSPDDLRALARLTVDLHPVRVTATLKGKDKTAVTVRTRDKEAADVIDLDRQRDRAQFANQLTSDYGVDATKVDLVFRMAKLCRICCERIPDRDSQTDMDTKFEADTRRDTIIWNNGGKQVDLTNFTATIDSEILQVEGDGVKPVRLFNIVARKLMTGKVSITVPAGEFAGMKWVLSELGANYEVNGEVRGVNQILAQAIQRLSPNIRTTTRYLSIGWQAIGDRRVYLTTSGGMTAGGLDSTVCTQNEDPHISCFRLVNPSSGEQLRRSVAATLEILNLSADRSQIWPFYGVLYAAPLQRCGLTLAPIGRTGAFKTAIEQLFMAHQGIQHLGKDFPAVEGIDPPSFKNSTLVGLSNLLFWAKDATLLIDDYQRSVHRAGNDKMANLASSIAQIQADGVGRVRANADGSQHFSKGSRASLLSNGEDFVAGHSSNARMVTMHYKKGDIDKDKLTACQKDAEAGVYCDAFSGYIQSLAGNYDVLTAKIRAKTKELRDDFCRTDQHARNASNMAQVAAGIWMYLGYCLNVGAIDQARCQELYDDAIGCLKRLADAQHETQKAQDPVEQFVSQVRQALASGTCHVVRTDGDMPSGASGLGWTKSGTDTQGEGTYRPNGLKVGWIDVAGNVHLMLGKTLEILQQHAPEGERIVASPAQLAEQLKQAGKVIPAKSGKAVRQIRVENANHRPEVITLKQCVLGCPSQLMVSGGQHHGAEVDDHTSTEAA
jgi:hypothetical protein